MHGISRVSKRKKSTNVSGRKVRGRIQRLQRNQLVLMTSVVHFFANNGVDKIVELTIQIACGPMLLRAPTED